VKNIVAAAVALGIVVGITYLVEHGLPHLVGPLVSDRDVILAFEGFAVVLVFTLVLKWAFLGAFEFVYNLVRGRHPPAESPAKEVAIVFVSLAVSLILFLGLTKYARSMTQLSETFAGDVLFASNDDALKPEGKKELESKLIKSLSQFQIVSVAVDGYTDNTGSDAHNLDLSTRRANGIKSYLVSSGIPSNVIETHGYGASKPVASNATTDGRAKNRRVEIVVKAMR
jgi:outer membrane protein OmpA-like peptidoglycan-associated protein